MMQPGIYRGGSEPIFGMWRLREDGVWLFSMPVQGAVWRVSEYPLKPWHMTRLEPQQEFTPLQPKQAPGSDFYQPHPWS